MYKCCTELETEMSLMHSSGWSPGAEFWCGRVIWWGEDAIKISAQLDTSSWYFLHRGSNWTETWQNIGGENLYWTRSYFWILWKDRFPNISRNFLGINWVGKIWAPSQMTSTVQRANGVFWNKLCTRPWDVFGDCRSRWCQEGLGLIWDFSDHQNYRLLCNP